MGAALAKGVTGGWTMASAAVVWVALAQPSSAQTLQFLTPLPGYQGTGSGSVTNAAGTVVAATNFASFGAEQAGVWSSPGSPTGLGFLPGPGLRVSTVSGISGDGTAVVGVGAGTLGPSQAFRWTPSSGMAGLGFLPGHGSSYALGTNADGSVVVGYGTSSNGAHAFRWTSSGMVDLGTLPGGANAVAVAVSADGSIVAGGSDSTGMANQPFLWTQATGMVGLGLMPGTSFTGTHGLSANGQVVVGAGSSNANQVAFRWTQASGYSALGTLPGYVSSSALAVNQDGTVIVGKATQPTPGFPNERAFRWTAPLGLQSIAGILGAAGVNLSNVDFLDASGVSADGTVVTGLATVGGPTRYTAWVAQIPRDAFGTLDLAGGTVTLGSLLSGGSVTNSGARTGTLTFGSDNADTTFTGTIQDGTSPVAITKVGTGTTTLAGANTYTGGTSILAGRLAVGGSISGPVAVGSAGTLGGTGTIVGSVVNNGTLSPGNSIGTLGISGSYSHAAGAIYQVDVNVSGQADRLTVTGTPGTATINGGAVQVLAASGTYALRTRYTILSASNGISGAFSGVTSNVALLRPSLSYDANNVYLDLTRTGFAVAAQNDNQRTVGNVLDQAASSATGDFYNVLSTVLALDTYQSPRALDAISGQNYAGFASVAVLGAQAFMNNFSDRAGGGAAAGQRVALAPGADDACAVEACDSPPSPRWGAWGGGFGGAGNVAGDASTLGFNYALGGFSAGLDYRFGPGVLAGITAGYANTTQYTQGLDGRGTSDTFQVGLYGSYGDGPLYLDALLGYARGGNRMQRTIAIAGLAPRTAFGNTLADQFFGQLEAGWRMPLARADATLVPFARLQGSTATQAGFTEWGASSLNLTVAPQTTNSVRTVLGTQLQAAWRTVDLRLRAGWSHEYADTARPVTASFAGAPSLPFTTQGATTPRDGAVLGVGIDAPVADATRLYMRYDGELQGGNASHLFTAGLRVVW